jgi:hypothetical protein
MIELLNTFSIQQILTFIILGSLAFKEAVDFIQWCKELFNEKFNKDYNEIKKEEQRDETLKKYNSLEQKIDYLTNQMETKIDKIENQINLLTESDMHDIKGWIVEKHHILMKQGWVDDFMMDTLEHRYSDYKAEDGNSFVSSLMHQIRELPNTPPEE